MARQPQTQWDFGELFPPAETRKVLSVSELTLQVKRLLESQVGSVWVTGEISNLRLQPSGHAYFTLKDAGAQLACVLFRGEAAASRDALAEGRKVNLLGDVTVYEARGQYQLRVTQIELQGVGALQQAFERLKQKLAAEGLFAPERKRPLPAYPVRIGVVTSPTAAAFRDVLHVIQRRFAAIEIILAPARVQGDGAAAEIAKAIRLLNESSAAASAGSKRKLDLVLVTRGGGSLEDLWAFNEEVVARAIFESALPVVSAVGHEIDFTIADFVADVRAATPSAAAEIITAGYVASRDFIRDTGEWLKRSVSQRLADERDHLESLQGRLRRAHPRRRLEEQAQRLDDLHTALLRCARSSLRERRAAWQLLAQRLLHVRPGRQLERYRERLANLEARLRVLSPDQVLSRGYSITRDAATGAVIRAAAAVKPGQWLRTTLQKGEVSSVVKEP